MFWTLTRSFRQTNFTFFFNYIQQCSLIKPKKLLFDNQLLMKVIDNCIGLEKSQTLKETNTSKIKKISFPFKFQKFKQKSFECIFYIPSSFSCKSVCCTVKQTNDQKNYVFLLRNCEQN